MVFDTLEQAWNTAINSLKEERINSVEIHWAHGTLTIQQSVTGNVEQPYKGWEIIEDA